ncbi:heme-copper oxidase subunit III [Candidatus Cyanaurora vandensis]|uniref:cytochrome c oxidase subunit 3 n=1 Tax=Candidatus Cyanaurora vandensis TaxID=2714958 RepID=UPI0025808B7C|nr:heme-copper oxidase subunit III [Candidatus Cyanaurora vandensis]
MQTSPNESERLILAAPATEMAHEHEATAHAHEEHPDLRLFGFTLFLVSEAMLFVGLFVAYLAFRAVATEWPPAGTPELEVILPAINTVILVASSFVLHQSEAAVKKGDIPGMRAWFIATIAMGAVFLAGQVYEYTQLEFTLQTGLFGGTFFVLTGFHGLHVLVGVLLMSGVVVRSFKKEHYTPQKHFGVEAANLYWHFVDGVWIVLFLLLYIVK